MKNSKRVQFQCIHDRSNFPLSNAGSYMHNLTMQHSKMDNGLNPSDLTDKLYINISNCSIRLSSKNEM